MGAPKFASRRVTRSYRQTINGDPETVFPLLCPVREVEWLDGWQHQMIYSESGLAEKGAIFSTPSDVEADTVWVITRHDAAAKSIQFVRFTPDSRVCVLDIAVRPKGVERSYVDISYTFTGVTKAGNAFVDGYTEETFLDAVTFWEKSMNHFLLTGERLQKDTGP